MLVKIEENTASCKIADDNLIERVKYSKLRSPEARMNFSFSTLKKKVTVSTEKCVYADVDATKMKYMNLSCPVCVFCVRFVFCSARDFVLLIFLSFLVVY